MAVEKSEADKGAYAKPAESPAPSSSAVDQEKLQMAEELRQTRAAMAEIGEMVKSGKLKLQDSPQPAAEPHEEDDSALVDRKELKKFAQGLQQSVANAFVQTTQMSARQMRDAQMELMRPKLEDFDKYEEEIKGILDKVDPTVAANPATIKTVYDIVEAKHSKTNRADALKAERAAYREELRSKGYEVPDDEEEALEEVAAEVEAAVERPAGRAQTAKSVARPSGGVAPAGDASASRPILRSRTERIEPLSREEKDMAARFGMSEADYRKYDPRSGWKPDTQGFKGKTRL